MRTVLVTGARAPVALDWARRLKSLGYRVLAAEDPALDLTRLSRAVDRNVALPSPRYQHREYQQTLDLIIEHESIDLLLPTCEEIFWLNHLRLGHWPLWSSPQSLLLSLHSKWTFNSIAQKAGLSVPETWKVESQADLNQIWNKSRELVFKPEFSRFGSRTIINPKHQPQLDFQSPWVAQEYCHGPEFCSYSVCHQGRVGAHVCYQPRARFLGGASTLFTSVAKPAIRSWVEHLVAETEFTGQLGLDFIEDEFGRVRALECNPRATSGLHLFGDSHRLAKAISGEFSKTYEARPGRTTWSRVALWNDPLPFLSGLKNLAVFRSRARDWNCSLTEAMTADICWNGEVA